MKSVGPITKKIEIIVDPHLKGGGGGNEICVTDTFLTKYERSEIHWIIN